MNRRTATFIPVLIPSWDDRVTPFILGGEGQYSCGRSLECDLVVSLGGVADCHCYLKLDCGRLSISRAEGHVWVNDLPLNGEWDLHPGDVLSLGPATFLVDAVSTQEPEENHSFPSQSVPRPQASAGPVHSGHSRTVVPPVAAPIHESVETSEAQRQEITRRESLLDQRERHLNEVARRLQENEASLVDRRRNLEELSRQITLQKSELTQSRLETDRQIRETDDIRLELDQLRTSLTEREQQVNDQQANADCRLREAEALRLRMDQKAAELSAQAAELSAQADEIRARETALESERNQLTAERDEAAAEQQQLTAFRKKLDESRERFDQVCQTQANDFRSREEQLSRQHTELEQRQNALEESEAELAGRREQLDAERAALESERHTFEAERTSIAADRENVDASRLELQQEQAAFAEERQALDAQLAAAESERRQLEADRADFLTEQQQIRAALDAERESGLQLAKELDLRLSELAQREQELNDKRQADSEEASRLAELQAHVVECENQLTDRENQLAARLEQCEQRELELTQRAQDVTTAEEQLTSRESAVSKTELQLKELQEELARRNEELADRCELTRLAEERLSERTQLLESREAEILSGESDAASQLVDARRLEDELRQKIHDLTDSVTALEKTNRGLQAKLERANDAAATESIEQMAALAAERESSMRARDEADQALRKLRDLEQQLKRREQELKEQSVSLDQRSGQLQELENQLAAQKTAAEQEIAEQNGREAEDLASRRLQLNEQAEELQRRSDRLEELQKQLKNQADEIGSEFQSLEAHRLELESRAAELSERVVSIKAWQKSRSNDDAAEPSASEVPSAREQILDQELARLQAEIERLQAVAQVAEQASDSEWREERESLISERDTLVAALKQLQVAFNEARQDLEDSLEACRVVQDLETRLSRHEETIKRLSEENADLQAALEKSAEAEVADAPSHDISTMAPSEQELLTQLEQLRRELSDVCDQSEQRRAEFESQLAERDRELTLLRHEQEASCSISGNSMDLATLTGQISSLNGELSTRDALIRDLKSELIRVRDSQTRELPTDDDGIRAAHRELDHRATVLDEREEEIRERSRMLEQNEDELEKQRRQMLEARQQLELARAELQQAMQSGEAVEEESFQLRGEYEEISDQANIEATIPARLNSSWDDDDGEEESGDASSGVALRAELANLFGIRGQIQAKGQSYQPHDVDTSEPAAAEEAPGVACSFSSPRPELQLPEEMPDEASGDDDQPDFVAAYMEELLKRTRAGAGSSLPSELKPEPEKPQNKATPKPTSFLEQYMNGGFPDLSETGTDAASSQVAEDSEADVIQRAPRAKIDRDKLRENMDSFRTLSTQSVENALASHAMRVERTSISARYALTGVLGIMAILLGIAHYTRAFVQPTLALGIVLAAVASAAELSLKLYRVRSRFRSASMKQTSGSDRLVGSASGAPEPTEGAPTAGDPMATHLSPGIEDSLEERATHSMLDEPIDDRVDTIVEDRYFEV
ncbi:MAG: hypothetical protein KDA96_06225 [Planctomycetaceae bacterium]|nr:hypothetical protein [Planctomycetaceae bacterium]